MLKDYVNCKETLTTLTDYRSSVIEMEKIVSEIRNHKAPQQLWLLQHPSIYTLGTGADKSELLEPSRFPVFHTGRGGRATYHGPGQLICYVMLDLNKREKDIRKYIFDLEQWIINTLAEFNIIGHRRKDRVGIWVIMNSAQNQKPSEAKIAAIGVRVRKWVSYHGISINIDPNLEHYSGIIPCGFRKYGVTSLSDLGVQADISEVAESLKDHFYSIFGSHTNKSI
jgi:lipoyl(octanoyl) transferase